MLFDIVPQTTSSETCVDEKVAPPFALATILKCIGLAPAIVLFVYRSTISFWERQSVPSVQEEVSLETKPVLPASRVIL
jgi:hypothetical protein